MDIIATLFRKYGVQKKPTIKPFFSLNSKSVLFQQEGYLCLFLLHFHLVTPENIIDGVGINTK